MYTDQQKPNLLQLTKLGKSFSKLLNVELMIFLFSPSNVTVTCYIWVRMDLFQAISHDIVIKCLNQTDENHSPDMFFFILVFFAQLLQEMKTQMFI